MQYVNCDIESLDLISRGGPSDGLGLARDAGVELPAKTGSWKACMWPLVGMRVSPRRPTESQQYRESLKASPVRRDNGDQGGG